MLKLLKIDSLVRDQHHYLEHTDSCYFVFEYTARGGFSYSDGNNFVINYKKSVGRKGNPAEYQHKTNAINRAATILSSMSKNWPLEIFLFVPVPPSKLKSDPLYDDRLVQTLELASNQLGGKLIYKELVIQTVSTTPSHQSEDGQRLSPSEHLEAYISSTTEQSDESINIIIFDDVITTGSHFKAMQSFLITLYPNANFIGLFFARRALGSNFEGFDIIDDVQL